MLRRCYVFLLFCTLLCVTGCGRDALMATLTPPADEAAARHTIDLLRAHCFDDLRQQLSPSADAGDLAQTLSSLADLFPTSTPTSIKVVGYRHLRTGDNDTTELKLEYQFPSTWVIASVTTQTLGGQTRIAGITVQPAAESLEQQNRFTFAGKGIDNYLVLLAAGADLAFSLYAFILCLRGPRFPRKWLWALATLVGLGIIGVNWNTGHWLVSPINIRIPPLGAIAVPYGPVYVFFSVPVGAILFLIRRPVLLRTSKKGNEVPPPAA